jgi:hypothetical protein
LKTQSNVIVHFGIVLGERAEGVPEDIQVAYSFLELIDPHIAADDSLRLFVQENINKKVFQICQAQAVDFGQYRMWVGRPHSQVIVVASECDAND